jgi:hypothetical protein
MSSGKQPPKGGNKPFLGDDDLGSELDAWDATFDALHDEAPPGAAPVPEQVMVWPAPSAQPLEVTPEAILSTEPREAASSMLDFDPSRDLDLDEHMTLDRAVPAASERMLDRGVSPPRTATDGDTMFDEEPGETDFSDVGAAAPPEALGDLLGRHGTSPPIDDEQTRLHPTTGRMSTRPGQVARTSGTESGDEDDEEQVFTSASRPTFSPPPVDRGFDDDLAPPPPPTPEPRRGPAIVRRTPLQVPIPSRGESHKTPALGVDPSAFIEESTRIQHVDEIRAQAHQSRSSSATLPPPFVEDDYADIEIDSSSDAADASASAAPIAIEPPSLDSAAIGRRTAHVVRRGEASTKSPPVAAPKPDDHALEMDIDEPPELAPASEDDFSDVAAAVGAREDDALAGFEAIPSIKPRRPSTPTLELRSAAHEPHATTGLEDALSGLEPVAQEDDDGGFALPDPEHGDALRELPTLLEPSRSGSMRPPAIADLYPRVKTPTSVPQPRAPRAPTPLPIEHEPTPEIEPELDLDAASRSWPEQVDPLPSATLDEACAQVLLVYERELSTVDESAASAALRVEAGRLCERLTDLDRARSHYDAALLADPRATAALRGLRRLARASGDLDEATRQIDAEIAVAGALERRPLGHYRIDLLMASGDQDLARVAVGELLDSAPSDVRALLAHLELAFLDGRAEEFGAALEQLAHAVTDPALRAAVQSARGALAAHHNDSGAAADWFAAAAESDPTALAARIGAVRHAAAQADGEAAARALVDLARQIETSDPVTAAAAAVRAQQWAAGEIGATAAAIATTSSPGDPLVARLAAETALASGDSAHMNGAFAHWAAIATTPAERAYAAARAAEIDPARGAELWGVALAVDPGDDYAAAQLRTAHVAADATQASIDVDLGVATDLERDRARLRAAYGMIAQGQLDTAIDVLQHGRAARPDSLAIAEALGEALAAAGRWSDRAKLFAELAAEPGEQLDREVAQLRSAIAWEEAVGAAAANEASAQHGSGDGAVDLQRATAAALEAWERVLEHHAQAPTAHAATIVLASRLGNRDVLAEVLARAQAAERSPWAITSLALRRARLFAADDAGRAEAILAELPTSHDDPRRTVAVVIGAARQKELGDAAAALEQRANLLDGKTAATEIATLRLRAAQLALDAGDAVRATTLLQRVEAALPQLGVVSDLLAAARRRAGERPTSGPVIRRNEPQLQASAGSSADAFVRLIRDGDLASAQGDAAAALALYQSALELRPGDPLAAIPLIRTAAQLRDPAPVASLALAQLRAAEDAGDGVAKAVAYELLSQIDSELRNDSGSAQIALESAATSDPSRIDLMHRLERNYAANDQLGELIRLRRAELEVLGAEHVKDRTALLVDLAGIATRDMRPELEVADMYRSVLDTDPKVRLALMHLESIVRRAGFSEELAQLEEKIAAYFEGDPRTQAAFWTRAGETFTEIGKIDEAVLRFGKAEGALPGHVPAIEAWRQAALKGQLWIDVAAAATRQAASVDAPPAQLAALHHFAGVALMDKALVGEQAMASFRRALEADPSHKDAFLRLRILLEEDANHDDLATLLAQRLDVEPEASAKLELHRALAELHRNFLSDRDTAKEYYRRILESDPNDLRAHAAIADIAWEQGNWQEAADALMARARLETQPEVLKTLCFRLGLIYADRLVDVPMALKAFQRALSYQPDDENTLIRLADLATQAGEWKLALGACERLVKNESDPDRRAMHLHRVAKIFKEGFGDVKRAERALNLALDGAPTNDDALTQLVQFYRDANDITSVRVHLNRVAGAMRARVAQHPQDGVAYRVISRAMNARAAAGVDGSRPIARAAAELADLLGASGEPEQHLLAVQPQPDLAPLLRPDADDVLFPRTVQVELRQVFTLLGDRIAKHVGVDLRPYGATRGDRLRARDNPAAAVAQSVASGLGFGEIDVYLSNRQPWAMVAEPTSPLSLVIGQSIASAGGDAIRFAAGSALKLAQASLAIPARLPADDLGVLVVALLRLFQPDFPILALDADAIAAQTQKLRRLIPTGLMNELKPFALAIDPQRFGHRELARDLKIAGLRAGLVASGSLLAGLRILAAQAEVADVASFLADPVAQGLIAFALGEDHGLVAR